MRRSEETTDDTTALELGCRPCVSAQGTNPVASTKKKRRVFSLLFFWSATKDSPNAIRAKVNRVSQKKDEVLFWEEEASRQ